MFSTQTQRKRKEKTQRYSIWSNLRRILIRHQPLTLSHLRLKAVLKRVSQAHRVKPPNPHQAVASLLKTSCLRKCQEDPIWRGKSDGSTTKLTCQRRMNLQASIPQPLQSQNLRLIKRRVVDNPNRMSYHLSKSKYLLTRCRGWSQSSSTRVWAIKK